MTEKKAKNSHKFLGSTKIMSAANMPTPFTGFLLSRVLFLCVFLNGRLAWMSKEIKY